MRLLKGRLTMLFKFLSPKRSLIGIFYVTLRYYLT